MPKPRIKTLRSKAHQELTKRLVALRKGAKMTQVELATKLDWPQSDVSRVELGERRLDVIEYMRWAEAVGFDAGEVLNQIFKAVE